MLCFQENKCKGSKVRKYVMVVQDMYKDSVTAVKCAVGTTDWFKVEVGLHQGSALSPFLFAVLMDRSADIEILLNDGATRRKPELELEESKREKCSIFYDGGTVSGTVQVTLKHPGKRLEHYGIKIQFLGQIGERSLFSLSSYSRHVQDRGTEERGDGEAGEPGGMKRRVKYFLRATISRRLNDITKETDILVHTLCTYPELNTSIKMEVGIEDCLHIEFEYNKSKYHLKDVIVGKIYFLLVRIKIKHMEVNIIKRETTGTGPSVYHGNETIAKYEIMDGAPVKGESIPIRLFLAGYELTPTMRDINKKFSVRYYLNLVLIDEEERRYFKQQEITLWRKGDIVRRSMSQQASIAAQRFEGSKDKRASVKEDNS
ncbi:vacuolar protein sorting-associated protein 26B isoform X1 [Silurus meridionalis]|nr:vacuolar protein sorting-associated protein 26B isoform X1 [Silurus meridionalis]